VQVHVQVPVQLHVQLNVQSRFWLFVALVLPKTLAKHVRRW